MILFLEIVEDEFDYKNTYYWYNNHILSTRIFICVYFYIVDDVIQTWSDKLVDWQSDIDNEKDEEN